MMAGTVFWNLIAAIGGFLFTFLISFQVTSIETAILRGTFVFFGFFVITFIFRFTWTYIARDGTYKKESETETNRPASQSQPSEGSHTKETSEIIRDLLNEDRKH